MLPEPTSWKSTVYAKTAGEKMTDSKTPDIFPEDDEYKLDADFWAILDHLQDQLQLLQTNNLIYQSTDPELKAAAIEYLQREIDAIYEEDWGNMSAEALQARSHSIINQLSDIARTEKEK